MCSFFTVLATQNTDSDGGVITECLSQVYKVSSLRPDARVCVPTNPWLLGLIVAGRYSGVGYGVWIVEAHSDQREG